VDAPSLWLANRGGALALPESARIFLATFLGGWAFQLVGHAFEAAGLPGGQYLADLQRPLFLTAEVLFLLGRRSDLRGAVGPKSTSPAPKHESYRPGLEPFEDRRVLSRPSA